MVSISQLTPFQVTTFETICRYSSFYITWKTVPNGSPRVHKWSPKEFTIWFWDVEDLVYLLLNYDVYAIFFYFFSVRLLSVLRVHSFFSPPPQRPMTSEGFSIPDFIHYIYFTILILEKEPVFSHLNVQC